MTTNLFSRCHWLSETCRYDNQWRPTLPLVVIKTICVSMRLLYADNHDNEILSFLTSYPKECPHPYQSSWCVDFLPSFACRRTDWTKRSASPFGWNLWRRPVACWAPISIGSPVLDDNRSYYLYCLHHEYMINGSSGREQMIIALCVVCWESFLLSRCR